MLSMSPSIPSSYLWATNYRWRTTRTPRRWRWSTHYRWWWCRQPSWCGNGDYIWELIWKFKHWKRLGEIIICHAKEYSEWAVSWFWSEERMSSASSERMVSAHLCCDNPPAKRRFAFQTRQEDMPQDWLGCEWMHDYMVVNAVNNACNKCPHTPLQKLSKSISI